MISAFLSNEPQAQQGFYTAMCFDTQFEPKVNYGDILALEPTTVQNIIYGNMYYIVLECGSNILRRITGANNFLISCVSPVSQQDFPISEIKAIYAVRGLMRQLNGFS